MAGWQVETLATGGPGDARQLAEYGVEQNVDIVAVLGGDGTIMQVAAALVGTRCRWACLPGGTGNQLAGNLRLSFNPVRAATALIRGTPRPFDLGRLERPDGTHYFAVGGGRRTRCRGDGEHAVVAQAAVGSARVRRDHAAAAGRMSSAVPFHIVADGVTYDFEALHDSDRQLRRNHSAAAQARSGDYAVRRHARRDRPSARTRSAAVCARVWHVVRETKGVYGETVFAARVSGAEIRDRHTGGAQPVQLDGELTGETPFVGDRRARRDSADPSRGVAAVEGWGSLRVQSAATIRREPVNQPA